MDLFVCKIVESLFLIQRFFIMLKIKNILLLVLLSFFSTHLLAQTILNKNHASYRRIGNWIYISSIPPVNAKGQTPTTTDAQVKLVFENLVKVLEEAGANTKDVVKINVYMNGF